MSKSNLRYLLPPAEVLTAYGVSVCINPDGTVDVSGAKEMRFKSETMDFDADNIKIHAKEKLVLMGDDSIHLNPHKKTILPPSLKEKCECPECSKSNHE
jgi:hypothetical protein